jgi:hypothetical protein
MSFYPQIGAGSVAQFPVSRSRRWRAIANNLEDGEMIMVPDTTAGQIEWKLSYQDLTNMEVQNITALFNASQGAFAAFTFIDPMANLLGWSEGLSQPGWQVGLLQTTAGMTDPLGTERAWSVANPNSAGQTLQQTLGIPGDYVACFSAYLWSSVAGTVTLQRDGKQVTVNVGPAWTRAYVSGLGTGGAAQSTFSIALAAGQTIDVWGLQVEAQPYPSVCKRTSSALGIYQSTYFDNDELTITSTSVGLSSCQIALMSQV